MSKYLNLEKEQEYKKIEEPAKILKDGGIVVFPTETVYGIGVNGLSEPAIKKLYKIKQRPINKPISLLVNSIEMIEKVAKDISDIEYDLIKKFFPGPLTIVLKKKENVPDILTAGLETVGIRMPENDIALKLIEYSGVPIATPSANISGKPSGTNMKEIMKDFNDKVDYFIDGGVSKIGVASTIVQIIDGIPHILRKGKISEEQVKEQVLLSKQKEHIIRGK